MHPVLFYIGSLPIGTYGVAIVCGLFSAWWACGRLARRRGMSPDFFYDLLFVLLVSGFVGARCYYIILNPREFFADPLGMIFSRQGFVFQGGFIAALIAGVLFARRARMPLLGVADVCAPALALAHAFGRIGCFFAGCCYGRTCLPGQSNALERLLSVSYPLALDRGGQINTNFNFAYQTQLQQGLLQAGAPAALPILPVQLFESFGNFMICLVLFWAWRRRSFAGQIFALYLLLYSPLRFGLEFLRGDAERGLFNLAHSGYAVSTGQSIALMTFAAGLVLWVIRRSKGLEVLPAMPAPEAGAAGAGGEAVGPRGQTPGARAARRRR